MRKMFRLVVLTMCLVCAGAVTARAVGLLDHDFREVVTVARSGQMDKAIEMLDHMIAGGSQSDVKRLSMAYNMRGVFYEAKGDTQKALGDYDKAITTDPKNADAYGNRSILYKKLGKIDQAKADAVAAKRIDRKVKVPTFD